MTNLLGGWQISGATFFRTGTPFSVAAHQRHRRRRRRRQRPAGRPRRRRQRRAPTSSSRTRTGDQNFWFNPAAFADAGGRHVRQRAAQPALQPRRAAVGHRAVQELQRWAARAAGRSSAPRSSTSSTTRTVQRTQSYGLRPTPTSAAVTSKSDDRATSSSACVSCSSVWQRRPACRRLPAACSFRLRESTTLRRMSFRTHGLARAAIAARRGHPAGRGTERRAGVRPSPRRRPPRPSRRTPRRSPAPRSASTWCPIPGGTFTMGSPANEAGHSDDEGPQVKVKVGALLDGQARSDLGRIRPLRLRQAAARPHARRDADRRRRREPSRRRPTPTSRGASARTSSRRSA